MNTLPQSRLKLICAQHNLFTMSTPLLCYILVGLPGSGKSTLAAEIQNRRPNYQIISTDQIRATLFGDAAIQGNWPVIETEVLRQIQQALSANTPIIYDATNCKRPHRIDLLQKLAHHPNIYWIALYLKTPIEQCKIWNRQRDRQVIETVIDSMAKSLKAFPPLHGEGFADVDEIDPLTHIFAAKTPKEVSRGNKNSINRRKNYELHCYSRLQDFEQLMHLIALMIQHPGIGNLQQTAPETLKTILGSTPLFETALAEISALMAKLHSPLYANPQTIQKNLDFLEQNGFFNETQVAQDLDLDPVTEDPAMVWPFTHKYSEKDAFNRVFKAIRWMAHNYSLRKETDFLLSQKAVQEKFFHDLCEQNIYKLTENGTFRRDIQDALKAYEILPSVAMKQGYFLGTGIFTKHELLNLLKVVQSLEKSIEDPVSAVLCKTFKARISNSALFGNESMEKLYPVRAIANQTIMDFDHLSEQSAYKRIKELEFAIENGKLLEIQHIKGSASYPDSPNPLQNHCVYPLQLVFHNISWYLGYEQTLSPNQSILGFSRLDRICVVKLLQESRPRTDQLAALHRLEKLYTSSPSIYLGRSPEDQMKYLSSDQNTKQEVEVDVELWITDAAFNFISEGDRRFPKQQLKMSKPTKERSLRLDKKIFTLAQSEDLKYRNRLIVKLPKWALDDIDFKKWIVSFGAEIKVINPASYAEKIKNFYQDAVDAYRN